MKIKQDFVTNSSSTSFIVDGKNIKDVAKKMIKIIFREWKQYDAPVTPEFKDKIFETLKNIKKDENILIPFTCNEETFIYKRKDESIQVETCTNHDWDDLDILSYFSDGELFDIHTADEMIFHNIENDEKITKKEFFKRLYEEWEEKNEDKT